MSELDPSAAVDAVLELLRGLPGIVAARAVDYGVVKQVVELERRYERGAFVPLHNLGVRAVVAREAAVAVLKDSRFREPPAPTVYLVEPLDGPCPPAEQCLEVEGKRYRVVGEEVLASRLPYREKTLPVGDSFVIFPERRSSPATPSYFLVPPLGFPELEQAQERLGIRGVVSISASAQADVHLRKACGFALDPALATLLLGFDLRRPPPTGTPPNP